MNIGANYIGNGICEFIIWAPLVEKISIHLTEGNEKSFNLSKNSTGYWYGEINAEPGMKYLIQIDDQVEFPDPVSNYQPDGVHGASAIVDHNSFPWNDDGWKGINLKDLIIYEIHIGTFTESGTFESAIEKLDYLVELGITAVEIMPVAQFPGERNWGYDGAYPFAPQTSYGGVDGMKAFVNACHQKGLAVILDVVYNHLGPEGNYISNFAPYFTDEYKTPWGMALNFDEPYSDEVRNYFIQNALYWMENFHVDGLRLDAIDRIYDMSAKHFLAELKEKVEDYDFNTNKFLIAESDLNDVKIINPKEFGGFALDGQWADDFHHSLHALLTGERTGYYKDFGTVDHLVKAMNNSFYYDGCYSGYRKRSHGNSAEKRPPEQFVICTQNHDQIGNRAFGERLSNLVSFEESKLAAGLMMLLPYIPLIFMGQEYSEKNPFLYFVDHQDKNLLKAVSEGRKEEFRSFEWKGEIPDPALQETFNKSKLNWNSLNEIEHQLMLKLYKKLIELKKSIPALINKSRENLEVSEFEQNIILLERWKDQNSIKAFFNLSKEQKEIKSGNGWEILINTADKEWSSNEEETPVSADSDKNKLMPKSFILFERR